MSPLWRSTGSVNFVCNIDKLVTTAFMSRRLRQKKSYSTDIRWFGSRVVTVLDLGAEGPGFKSKSRLSGNSLSLNCSHPWCFCSPSSKIGSSPLKGCEGNCRPGGIKVTAAYCRVYDSRHLQAGCQEPWSAPEPYAWYLSTGYLFNSTDNLRLTHCIYRRHLILKSQKSHDGRILINKSKSTV